LEPRHTGALRGTAASAVHAESSHFVKKNNHSRLARVAPAGVFPYNVAPGFRPGRNPNFQLQGAEL
jgi:hypothetical protein